MRNPSAKILDNRIDVYNSVLSKDDAGGVQYLYPTVTYQAVPSTVQAGSIEEVIDEQERITRLLPYKIILGAPLKLNNRAKILWTDRLGKVHELFYEVDRDEAGRGGAFGIRAIERI